MLTPAALFVIGIIAILVEFFVPAFGLVGIAGAGTLVASVIIAFRTLGNTAGSIFLLMVIILVPAMVITFFRLFPRTFMGKRLILHHSQKREEGYTSYEPGMEEDFEGVRGKALTDLRPAGIAFLNGKRVSVVTRGDYIEKETDIEVTSLEGSRIVVKRRI